MQVAMDVPTSEHAPQDGIIDVRDFVVFSEPAWKSIVAPPQNTVQFSHLLVELKSSPGNVIVSDGLIAGPILPATASGKIDFERNETTLRGVVLPLYQFDRVFPHFGMSDILIGFNYEIAGPLQAPSLRIDPLAPLRPLAGCSLRASLLHASRRSAARSRTGRCDGDRVRCSRDGARIGPIGTGHR
jgi:hypothetical protein